MLLFRMVTEIYEKDSGERNDLNFTKVQEQKKSFPFLRKPY